MNPGRFFVSRVRELFGPPCRSPRLAPCPFPSRRPGLNFAQALNGYLIDAQANNFSPMTIRGYQDVLKKFCAWAEEPELAALLKHIRPGAGPDFYFGGKLGPDPLIAG